MKRALLPLGVMALFCASGMAVAQFNIPGIPSIDNPFHPSTPTTPNSDTVNGITEMAKGASGISLQDEMKIGGAVAVDIVARNGGVVKDEVITRRVALIGKSLSWYCSRRCLPCCRCSRRGKRSHRRGCEGSRQVRAG